MADVDSMLAASLRQAKTKPMYFAFVAKGTEGKLLVNKKKISLKDASDAKKEIGGGTIYKGRCQGEDAKLVFEIGKEPPATLNALTKKTIKLDAGLTLDVEYRFSADLAAEENSDEATAEGVPPAASPPAPPAPTAAAPPPAAPAMQFAARLKALQPVLAKVETIHKAAADQAKAQIVEGNNAFVAKQYDAAIAALDRAQAILKQGLTAPAAAPVAAPAAAEADKAKATSEFTTRLKALQPVVVKVETINKAAADQAKLRIAAGNKAFVAKQYDAAIVALDQAQTILKQGLAAAGPTASADAATGPDTAAEWERRIIALEPKVLEAQKTRGSEAKWMIMFMTAQDLGSAGDFAKSFVILDKLELLLNAKPAATDAPATDAPAPGLVKKRKFLVDRWQRIPQEVRADLQKLKKAIESAMPSEDADKLIELSEDYLDEFYSEMKDAIDNAINAGDAQYKGAISAIGAFRTKIAGEPLIQHLKKNTLKADVTVESILLDALAEVEHALAS